MSSSSNNNGSSYTKVIKVRYAGRDNQSPSIYLPVEICAKYQIKNGDQIVIKEGRDGELIITPYIPYEPLP